MTSCDMSKLIDIQRKKSNCPMSLAGKYNTKSFCWQPFCCEDKALFFWEITGGLIFVLNTKSITRKKGPPLLCYYALALIHAMY